MYPEQHLATYRRDASELYLHARHHAAAIARRRARRLNRAAAVVATAAGWLGALATRFHNKARAACVT